MAKNKPRPAFFTFPVLRYEQDGSYLDSLCVWDDTKELIERVRVKIEHDPYWTPGQQHAHARDLCLSRARQVIREAGGTYPAGGVHPPQSEANGEEDRSL